ncbi:MAG: amidohydrolase, partial [Betaproteobacteria bacterium]|nr:amidohydrolase [Betaproteobacteria bacterium]
ALKVIDLHSHYSTRRGYLFQSAEEIALQEKTWGHRTGYRTDEEMVQDFRDAGAAVFLDFGFTLRKSVSLAQMRELHDYAGELIARHPDVILGGWISIDPSHGKEGLREYERCLRDLKMVGLLMNPAMINIAPTDPLYEGFYEISAEARAPVLIAVGYTVEGAGLPGGGGNILEYNHPRYVDEVAAKHPDLTIIAGRQAWPWVNEMIAVLLHKPNVWHELHGWSPKYFTRELKWEISHRLKNKVLFGADYPLLGYERLIRDWESEGYSEEILQRVYHRNARALFRALGRDLPV